MLMLTDGSNFGFVAVPELSVEDDVMFDFTFHIRIYIGYDTRCSLNSHTHTFGHSTSCDSHDQF